MPCNECWTGHAPSTRRGLGRAYRALRGYDDCMKRLTVSLPDDLVDKIKRAAGGDGRVSSYVATALADYQQQESLDELLAQWRAETPVPSEVQAQVEAELTDIGLAAPAKRRSRTAG